ncbi:DUF559 domain-containing protein [Rhizobium leguminosarum bv. viciae]|uniref:endonuclease domain-containing protein n=1 Tax=Rhizobium leguminosarum TaxID=384 RepID=UPI001039BE79|nr:DUF559 domain-containing protein [Rhizobium leguminosarum]TCA17375.1 DUF559 domain-containing protein [Rhizobium leguminosarum bv. viciae]
MDDAHKKAIIIRGALTAVFIAAGFVFPLLWAIAAFFAYATYTAIPEPKPITPEDMYRARQSKITVDDPDWREYFLATCESPAETAFLEAMIKGYTLMPDNGILVGSGIELDMQVEYRPYRLDFLVNKWLVVEVDGAAWHSSAEAVERDGVRDAFFAAKGFRVLRIPAKVVFNTPTKAVEMVRAAVAHGRQAPKVVTTTKPISIGKTFTNSVSSVGKFLDDVDAHVTKAKAIQEAMGPSRQTFDTEKMVIDFALDSARREIELEEKLSADPNLRKHYEAAHAELDDLLRSTRSKHDRNEATTITISPISWPKAHPDPVINATILEMHFNLTGDRTRFFEDVRQQISKDPRLSPRVQSHLEHLGCLAVWTEIARKKESFSLDAFLKEMEAKGGGSAQSKPPPN